MISSLEHMVQMYVQNMRQMNYFNWNQGAAFGFLLLLLSSLLIWLALKITGQDWRKVIK